MTPSIAFHLSVDRDHAKQLFSAREPQQRTDLIQHWHADPQWSTGGRRRDSEPNWRSVHGCLTACPEGSDAAPAGAAFLGGRELAAHGWTVHVLRPDMVPMVADGLRQLDRSACQERLAAATVPPSETDSITADSLAQTCQSLAEFFTAAAERRDAIVFVAEGAS